MIGCDGVECRHFQRWEQRLNKWEIGMRVRTPGMHVSKEPNTSLIKSHIFPSEETHSHVRTSLTRATAPCSPEQHQRLGRGREGARLSGCWCAAI